jgi:hypothetical protein
MTTSDLCVAFGVGESTVHAKARVIEKILFDPKWGASQLDWQQSTFMDGGSEWSAGRSAHDAREVQEVAFAKGIIPYIPADGQDRS